MCHPIPTLSQQQTRCAAKALNANQRQRLAIDALANKQPISNIAKNHHVSRQFVYRQASKAEQALNDAFISKQSDDEVLFHLPVTKAWLRQLSLGLLFICHSSLRGVVELLRDVFRVKISVGTVHNIAQRAVEQARQYNQQQDLSDVRIGAHDEIFQQQRPVLAGVDVDSTYCYLLSVEEQRDGDTWGLRLLELQDRGFDPEAIIADAGSGMRKGQELAMAATPRRGDVFHALKTVNELVAYLQNRAGDALAACDKLEHKQALSERRHGRCDLKVSQRLRQARAAETRAIDLADDVALLAKWLQQDIFAVAGPLYAERCDLYDFIVAELCARQHLCAHRIGPVCTMLKNQRDALLAFAAQLDRDLDALAEDFDVPVTLVRQLLHVQAIDPNRPRRWQQEARLRAQMRGRFYHLNEAVGEVARRTVRASSIIENYNSRLRSYFFLRRHLGPDYLHLLQFFLNHRRFLRSERPERVGKSPAELLTGRAHPHWLEMLGYTLFSPN